MLKLPPSVRLGRSLLSALFVTIASAAAAQTPTFNALITTPTGGQPWEAPINAAVGDYNGDGKLDAIVTDGSQNLRLMLGNGNGTFSQSNIAVPGAAPGPIRAADLNGDGRLDAVFASPQGNLAPAVVLNTGNASGVPQFAVTSYAGLFGGIRSVTVGDLNGDASPDFIVGNCCAFLRVYLNNGNGTFAQGAALGIVPGAGQPSVGEGVIADVSGDGNADYIVTSNQAGVIDVFFGNGDGTFQAPTTLSNFTTSVAAADVNGDGRLDLLAGAYGTPNELLVYLNMGGGAFGGPAAYSTGGNGNGWTALAPFDVNGDGKLDVAFSNSASHNVSVLLGDGSGSFGAPLLFAVNTTPLDVDAGDFTGDGKPDIATVGNGNRTFGVLTNTTPFAPPAATPLVFTRSTTTAEGWKKYTVTFTATQSGDHTVAFNLTAGGPSGDNSIIVDAVKITDGGTTIFSDGFESPALSLNTGVSANGGFATFGNWEFTNYAGILDNSPPNWGLDAQGLGSADGTVQYAYVQAVFGTLGGMKSVNTFALTAGETYTLTYYQASRRDFGGTTTYTVTIDTAIHDRDGDGVPDDQDAFPDDPSESSDLDDDGVGDNGDAFPEDAGEQHDSDGDGVGDNGDAFPNDASETQDTDGDGVGDNADAFDNDPTESTDTDGDGVGNNADAFDNDPTETTDTDGDGVGDNADAFDNDPTETTDSDGDGVGDNGDLYPNDPSASANIVIAGVTTSVPARNGAQLTLDLGAATCSASSKNHGQYVSCVGKVLNALRAQGTITAAEKDYLQSVVAQSSIGKK